MSGLGLGLGLGFDVAGGASGISRIPGQQLILIADLGLNLAGGTWADQSGHGNNVTKVGTPTLSSGVISGKDAVQFASGSYFRNLTTKLNADGAAFTVLTVGKNGSGALFANRQAGVYQQAMLYDFGGGSFFVNSDGVTNSYSIPASAASETHSASVAFQSVHQHNGAGNVMQVWINRTARVVTQSPGSGDVTETGAAGFFVGHNANGSQDWAGLIREIRVVDHALSAFERGLWDAYVSGTYPGL